MSEKVKDCTTAIITVNYNSVGDIKRLYNDYIKDIGEDFIVVDNNSNSDLQEWCDTVDVKYIDTGKNIGYAGGNNHGINDKIDSYDYFWILNPDTDIIDIDVLNSLTTIMEKYPNLGIVVPTIMDQNREKYDLPSRFEGILRKANILTELPENNDDLIYTDHVPGSAILLRRDMIQEIGLLDERFFLYVEETEYCYRARQHGYHVAIHRGSQIMHQNPESESNYKESYRVYYQSRNRFLLARMRFSLPKRLLYYCALVGFYGYEAVDIAKNNTSLFLPMILGIIDGIVGNYGRRRYLTD